MEGVIYLFQFKDYDVHVQGAYFKRMSGSSGDGGD
jgi:hypothetical protein